MKKNTWELLDSSHQGVERFFVPAYNNTAGNNQLSTDSYKKHFLLKVKIDGKNFYDQPINDSTKQYAYFKKNYQLITVDLSKQKALDAGSRAIKQIIFIGKIKAKVANAGVIIYYIL